MLIKWPASTTSNFTAGGSSVVCWLRGAALGQWSGTRSSDNKYPAVLLTSLSYAKIDLATVPEAAPTTRNHRTTSWPAPFSAKEP